MPKRRLHKRIPDPAHRCLECRGNGCYLGAKSTGLKCRVCDGSGIKVSFAPEARPLEESVHDPILFKNEFWPHVNFYDKQMEIIYSVHNNDETFVPAGNMLGKDFVTAFICLWFFWSHRPCRIITTSVKDDHLRVLWGEMGYFIQSARKPVLYPNGPLVVTHREIRWELPDDRGRDPLSYIKGMVSEKGEGLSGHHIAQTGDGVPRTLIVGDEASALAEVCYTMASAWANRALFIGNCWDSENFFKHAIKGKPGSSDSGGDIPDPDTPGRFYRKVIRIKAEDSPNVQYGLLEEQAGEKSTNTMHYPGVLSHREYKKRRMLWDPVRQCVGLDADFYEGGEVKLFPVEWLNRAEQLALNFNSKRRRAETMGIDTAQGGDNTCWTIIDHLGIIDQISKKTPDTSVITSDTLGLMKKYRIEAENVLFDAGGGGREHADRMRREGHPVRTVAFGSSATPEMTVGMVGFDEREENQDIRYSYKNKRAEMYGYLRNLLNPDENPKGFAIPSKYVDLRQQLLPIPLWYDDGRMYLPPKHVKTPDAHTSTKTTMIKLIGRSPDEADSLVLATYGLKRKASRPKVGVAF